MAPYKYIGALYIGFQLSITIGILVANVLNYFFAKIEGGWGWRFILGGAMIPAIIIMIDALILPDMPNSMIKRGLVDEAKEKLKKIRGIENVNAEFNDMVAASEASKQVEHPWKNILQRKYMPHLCINTLIRFFEQFTWINVIMFYASVLFNNIGFDIDASLMSVAITGFVNVFATFVSIYGVDRWGRRFIFLEGGTQMFICQSQFGMDRIPVELPKWYAIVMVTFICINVSPFAWSWVFDLGHIGS